MLALLLCFAVAGAAEPGDLTRAKGAPTTDYASLGVSLQRIEVAMTLCKVDTLTVDLEDENKQVTITRSKRVLSFRYIALDTASEPVTDDATRDRLANTLTELPPGLPLVTCRRVMEVMYALSLAGEPADKTFIFPKGDLYGYRLIISTADTTIGFVITR